MYSKTLSATLMALAVNLVAAQTETDCNPLEKTCPKDPAFGDQIVTVDFTKGKSDVFKLAAGTTLAYDGTNGAVFEIKAEGNAPTITSNKYLFYGKVDVVLQASYGIGVVTSVVLQSDDLDEIDWEWLGGDSKQVQTNYFSKGDTTTYDRGGFSPIANPQSTFHTYTIDWTPDAVKWIIDGTTVRTLTYQEAKGGATFPQTPMQLKLGTWVAGGSNAPEGTIQWAGGKTNFADAPFKGFYKSVTIQDYANGVKGASSYEYSDRSGSSKSIKVNTGGSSSGGSDSDGSSASSSTVTTVSTISTGTGPNPTSLTTITSVNTTLPTGGPNSSGTGVRPTQAVTTPPTQATGPPTAPNSGVRSAANIVAVGAALCLSYLIL